MKAFELIAYSSLLLLYAVTILYGIKLSALSKALRLIFIFLLALSISESIGKYLWIHNKTNLGVLHLFSYVEWFLMTWFYALFYPKKNKWLIGLASFIVVGSLLTGSLFFYNLKEYNVIGFFSLKLFVVVMSIRELYQYHLVSKNHYYFVNLALLLSGVVSLTIFSFGNVLKMLSASIQEWLWIINGLVFIIGLFLMFVELQKNKKWKAHQ